MRNTYEAKVVEDHGRVYLSVTHNGHQWTSMCIHDPLYEIPHMIGVLADSLAAQFGERKKREPGRCDECHYPFPHHSPGCSLR